MYSLRAGSETQSIVVCYRNRLRLEFIRSAWSPVVCDKLLQVIQVNTNFVYEKERKIEMFFIHGMRARGETVRIPARYHSIKIANKRATTKWKVTKQLRATATVKASKQQQVGKDCLDSARKYLREICSKSKAINFACFPFGEVLFIFFGAI